MKMKTLLIGLSICVVSTFSYAQNSVPTVDVTEGIVEEGVSLPIGVSLGDTFGEIENTIGAIEEFDLNERFCVGLSCTYTARDAQDEELGQVRIRFVFNSNNSTFTAASMRWTFENWVTSRGLSLKAMKEDITSKEELLDIYPEGLALFRDTGTRRSIGVVAFNVGIRMIVTETPTRSSASGTISIVR